MHLSYKFLLEKKYQVNQLELSINNPGAISNLAHIDYAIFSKSGVLTQKNEEEIVGIIVKGDFYYISANNIIQK